MKHTTLLLTIALSAPLLASCEKKSAPQPPAQPKYTVSCGSHSVLLGKRETTRTLLTISRDGGGWTLEIPSFEEVRDLDFSESDFEETDDGYSLRFRWGGGRYFWYEIFFFKESGGEPCLYKIESTASIYERNSDGDFDEENDTQTRSITPPIPISELSAEKINALLGRGDREQ